MKYRLIPICIFILCSALFPQQKVTIQDIRQHFENFDYLAVIKLSSEALLNSDTIVTKDFVEIQMMKGVSHFVLNETPLTRRCFIEILKADSLYQIDSEKTSPKIVRLFTEVKNEYRQSIKPERVLPQITEVTKKTVCDTVFVREDFNRHSLLKSLILPGWGHLDQSTEDVKGWVIASAALVNTSALIYYIFDTNKKEKSYLGENDISMIKSKYNDYNSSYKMRNVLLCSLVGIWAYAQIDYLFFNKDAPVKVIVSCDPIRQSYKSNNFSLFFRFNL